MGMDASDWDERYRQSGYVWSADPNRFVVEQVDAAATEPVAPDGRRRTALDLACGEGRNAVWLATRGWQVTGVDISAEGLAKGERLAADNDVSVEYLRADATSWTRPGAFDLVVLAYLQLPAEGRRAALDAAMASLRDGGTLVVVAHDSANLGGGVGGPQVPEVLYRPQDVLADLAASGVGHVVEHAATEERVVDGADRPALDVVVRARRVRFLQVWADVACPFTHAGLQQFVAARSAAGLEREVLLDVRSWPLEVVNGRPLEADFVTSEVEALRAQIDYPSFAGYDARRFPSTLLPAMAVSVAARRAGPEVAEAVALELRSLLFEHGADVSDPAVLSEVVTAHGLEVTRADEAQVLADHAEGVARGVVGSPHFFTGSGGFFCPALDVSHDDDGNLVVRADPSSFERFLAAAFA